jgi:hypothetical protein
MTKSLKTWAPVEWKLSRISPPVVSLRRTHDPNHSHAGGGSTRKGSLLDTEMIP